jgi:hypothetical protein
VTTDDSEKTTPTPDHPHPLSISALLSCETDPALALVLQHYRDAEVALQRAIDQLREMGRPRWALACSSRAHELCVQANRYIALERKAEGGRP